MVYQADVGSRKATLERSMKEIPQSEKLWKATAVFQSREEHAVTLNRALKVVPESKGLSLEGMRRGLSVEDERYLLERGLTLIKDADLCLAWAELSERFKEDACISEACKRAVACDFENVADADPACRTRGWRVRRFW